jgi:hypothetical protein
MKFSKKGYLRNSPDVNNPQNIIQGGNITMKGVELYFIMIVTGKLHYALL